MSDTPSLMDTTRSEFLKFRTVRASFIGLATFVVLTVGIALLISLVISANWSNRSAIDKLAFDPVTTSLTGVFFAQFASGVLGARFITSEYASGAIRTTLAAVPRRVHLVLAKAIVLFAVFFVASEVVTFAGFSVAQMIYRANHLTTGSLSTSVDLRAVVFAGVFLTCLTLIGFGLGLLLRTTSITISVYVTVLLIIPIIINFFPTSWQDHVTKYLPANLGAAMMSPQLSTRSFSWGTSAIILAIYTVAVLVAGSVALSRRDA